MMEQDEFNYSIGVTSPQEYPTEVHEGFLNDGDNYISAIPKVGVNEGGWLGDGKMGGQGGSIIPSQIDLTYVAYAEKKFYHLDAALPKDKILASFRKGFSTEGKTNDEGIIPIINKTYDTFSIGLAPGGMVVIWLSGKNHRVEICRLQAKEVFLDKNDFLGFNDPLESQQQFYDALYKVTVPDSIKADITKNGIPFRKWDYYRERFKYRFVLNPYDGKDQFTYGLYTYYNGETDEFLQDELNKKEYMQKGIPLECLFMFKVYHVRVIFDEAEMLEVFRKLKRLHPDKPIDVIIKPTFEYQDMKISIKCGNEEIRLTKYKVK